MEILLLGAGCQWSDINMVTGWEQLQEMDVHLKFPDEDQLAENDRKDSVWGRLQALTGRSLSNWSTQETDPDLVLLLDKQDLHFHVFFFPNEFKRLYKRTWLNYNHLFHVHICDWKNRNNYYHLNTVTGEERFAERRQLCPSTSKSFEKTSG